jgi:hypothetical protein
VCYRLGPWYVMVATVALPAYYVFLLVGFGNNERCGYPTLDTLLKILANFHVVTEWTPVAGDKPRREVNKHSGT